MTARTVVITGTSSGFGRIAVDHFAKAGWKVVATVRKTADLETHAGLDNQVNGRSRAPQP